MHDPRRPPWTVALTGGIGSGKSAVASAFAALGACVIDTDQIARELVQPDQAALQEIARRWGNEMLDTTGQLERRKLRTRIFAHPEEKTALEAILHPRIRSEVVRRLEECTNTYAIVVIPLLLETAQTEHYDRVLVVDCSPEQQRQRVHARDGSDHAEIDAILQTQATRAARLAAADDVLDNDQDRDPDARNHYLQGQVAMLHRRYLDLSQGASTRTM